MLLVDKPMPEGCDVCPLMYDYIECRALKDGCRDDDDFDTEDFDWTTRPGWCPLKEQEAIKPILTPWRVNDDGEVTIYKTECGKCGSQFYYEDQKYCSECGTQILWEDR